MADAMGWPLNVAIPTKTPRHLHLHPTCYKLDVANKELKIGIEIDGNSHAMLSRKAQDQKKEDFFRSIGWTVLRFTNKEVDQNLNGCVLAVQSLISKLRSTTTILPGAT